MHIEVRRCMAIDYSEDFRPERVSELGTEIKDMDASEYEEYRKVLEAQKAKIRSGYQRRVKSDRAMTINQTPGRPLLVEFT